VSKWDELARSRARMTEHGPNRGKGLKWARTGTGVINFSRYDPWLMSSAGLNIVSDLKLRNGATLQGHVRA